jgi:hypothetical protein
MTSPERAGEWRLVPGNAMHCPTCRHDNPATTRFCSACGAVLVESAKDGRRRRVLRPWGLRRSAPPTISPDMPDLLDAAPSAPGTRLDPSVRFDLWIVAGLVVAVVAGAWVNGGVRAGAGPLGDGAQRAASGAPAHVSATMPSLVQEARLKSPPLVDASPAAVPRPAASPRGAAEVPATARAPARSAPVPPVVVASSAREPALEDAGAAPTPVAAAPVEPVPAPPPDRWSLLRNALAQCGSAGGAIARAVCEQEARLAHCESFWGLVPACPVQRTEFGQ